MALTSEESANLMNDFNFRGKIKVSALRYATYIMNEPNSVQAHSARLRWATNTYQQPDMVAQQIHPAVVMEDAIQESGAEASDQQIQVAVETVVNKVL